MAFEDPINDPLATPGKAAEKTPHAGGIEDPTVEYGSTSLDEATRRHELDKEENIPSSLEDSLIPVTPEEQEAARRAVEAVRNKPAKTSKLKKVLAFVGLGAVVGTGVGATVVATSGNDNETTPANTPASSAPVVPGTTAPETVNPTSIEQGATSVTITTPSAEVTTSAPVVGELSPSVLEQVAGNKAVTRGILEKQFGQSFAPESILAAANTIDLPNIDKNPSVFGIQEIPYTEGMTTEDATNVYNSYVANESTRIVNLLIQARDLESTVAVPKPFSGVTPDTHLSVQDLILADAKGKFALDGVSEAVLINGVPGTPDGILQHLKDIANDTKITQYDRVVIMGIPEPSNRTPDSPDITGVTPLEGTDARGLSGVTIQTNNLIYKSAQYLVNEDYKTSGNFTVAPGISGKLLQDEEKLALYKNKDGNLLVELTGYEAHTN